MYEDKDPPKPKKFIIKDANGVKIGEVYTATWDGEHWEWAYKASIDDGSEDWHNSEFEAAEALGRHHDATLKYSIQRKDKKYAKWLKGKKK